MAAQAHGGLRPEDARASGREAGDILDFSASVNPFGPSPRVREALAHLDLSRYPDPDAEALRRAIAERHGVSPAQILTGNGACELIHLAVRVFVRGGQRPVAFTPTFGEFERACRLVGATIFPWQANAERGFRWTFRNKADVLRRVTPPLVYLCNPNNPTGVYVDEEQVRALGEGLTGGPLLLDEAYINFVNDRWDATPLVESGRVLLLRSMTKDYGLAGLRLGFLIAPEGAVQAAKRLQPEWSVSAAAQVAGLAALEDDGYLRHTLNLIQETKAQLVDALHARRYTFQAGRANFVLIRINGATAVRRDLLREGVAVRDCTSFGLPDHIRVAVRTPEENARLLDALERVRPIGAEEGGR